ncbi:3-oxoacyl-[acyl-carrier-protein] reductase FabG [Serratia rubidaea]|uniref:3-oxoacyl-[acyl-carrier-protein] reductase FabG n=1 Tax=Serratia rubidaea TaxID=61652 RepID=A0A4V6JI25_SERRU|nr:3-oxoacyl-[acyl-carrier-protein] reductase FabG [Serratia rubidaea]
MTLDGLHIQQLGDTWRQVIETNLNAVFYWNKHLLPAMMSQGEGALLLMSSVSAIKGNVGQTAYGASKAAMVGLDALWHRSWGALVFASIACCRGLSTAI